jgi:hypothetical protein
VEHRDPERRELVVRAAGSEVGELELDLPGVPQTLQEVPALVLGARVLRVGKQVYAKWSVSGSARHPQGPSGEVSSNTNSLQPCAPPTVRSLRSSKPRSVQNSKICSGVATSNG